MGSVGKDKYSKILEEKAKENGLNVKYQYVDAVATGTCAVLITNGGKYRSLCANLSAANHFSLSHIEEPENKRLIQETSCFYISVSNFFPIIFLIYINYKASEFLILYSRDFS
jgi:adenosine kinase